MNKFGSAIQDTVAKARKFRDKYTNAAKDLARVPNDAKDVLELKPSRDAFDEAADLRRKRKR